MLCGALPCLACWLAWPSLGGTSVECVRAAWCEKKKANHHPNTIKSFFSSARCSPGPPMSPLRLHSVHATCPALLPDKPECRNPPALLAITSTPTRLEDENFFEKRTHPQTPPTPTTAHPTHHLRHTHAKACPFPTRVEPAMACPCPCFQTHPCTIPPPQAPSTQPCRTTQKKKTAARTIVDTTTTEAVGLQQGMAPQQQKVSECEEGRRGGA